MVTIGVEQCLSIRDLNENWCLENIQSLYKYDGICDDKQQYKAILESAMVYTTDGTTDISPMSINSPELKKKIVK